MFTGKVDKAKITILGMDISACKRKEEKKEEEISARIFFRKPHKQPMLA